MLASYVLRLVPDEAAAGRVVGEIEAVRTGQITTVRDVSDLIAVISGEHRPIPPPIAPPEEPS